MFARHSLVRIATAAGMVAVLVAGCAQMRPSRNLDTYEATLTGAQEVPPVSTPAAGMAEISLNNNTNVLIWKVTYSGLTSAPVGGHIHGPAAPGQNAGVLIPFTAVGTQPITGQATLTAQQAGELAKGLWYVNIHSATHPDGEIRGQLRRRR